MALLALAGCSTASSPLAGTPAEPKPQPQLATNTMVIEGTCPQIFLRDGTAYYRTYARGGDGDPQKIVYQASLAETSRACTINEAALNITVVAKGRLITGPMGSSGRMTLPVRVEVLDGETPLYSEVTNFEAEIPAGGDSAQFIFRKDNISIPGGAGKKARIYISFDAAQKATGKKRRK